MFTFYKNLSLLTLLLCPSLASLQAQVIWSEYFDGYADGTTIGANNNTANPSADWMAVCPNSAAATDYFHVVSGLLEGRDTNGPATWESEDIDISGCSGGVEVTVALSEAGDLEGCRTGACNATDWISIATSIDGGAYTRYTSSAGGNCITVDGCTDGDYVTLDDFADFTFNTGCLYGNSLRIRIEVQTWAGTEFLRIDDVEVTCNTTSCNLLPIELDQFEVTAQAQAVQVDWSLPVVEHTLAYFELERSTDGIYFERLQKIPASTEQLSYQTWDEEPLPGTSYYRLRTVEVNTEATYSPIRALARPLHDTYVQLYPNPANEQLTVQLNHPSTDSDWTATVYDWSGRVVAQYHSDAARLLIPTTTLPNGAYLLQLQTAHQAWQRRFVVQH